MFAGTIFDGEGVRSGRREITEDTIFVLILGLAWSHSLPDQRSENTMLWGLWESIFAVLHDP